MPYPPEVLQRSRRIGSGTAGGLPVVVGAGAAVMITATVDDLVASEEAPLPANTRVRLWVLGCTLTTDAGGSPFLQVQNANLQTGGGAISTPLNTGSPLGLLNGAALAGELNFDSNDAAALGVPAENGQVLILVKNPDAAGHNVTAFSVTLGVETVQYDAPRQGD